MSYREYQEQKHQGHEHQREIAADGEELQNVDAFGEKRYALAERSVERLPDQVMRLHSEARRACRAGWRHLADLARREDNRAKYATDRLREAVGRILDCGIGVGIAAI